MLVSVGDGGVAGGSGMQYFVGDFDGKRFVAQDTLTRFLDYGKDYYAAIQINNLDRPVTIGWMNNWQYANDIPTSPFSGGYDPAATVKPTEGAEWLCVAPGTG